MNITKILKIENETDTMLLADFQYWSDGVWFNKGTYPTKEDFNWFKSQSLEQRYILINGENNNEEI
jgi:hypothetical protein|tara:strand:- start:459 stop:656 length:198 start_codon:yes stop_codon:yes gene_type:complete